MNFSVNPSCRLWLLLLLSATIVPAHAESASTLAQVKKIYVESFGPSQRAAEMRRQIVHRLQKSSGIQVVPDQTSADALLRGAGQIWTTGQVSLSPRSNSVTQPVKEGYLSVEVVGKNNQTLWSYLVTPSKFPWGGVSDDLARQIVIKLVSDIKGERSAEQPPASATLAKATLKGVGATFPAPLYRKWFELFAQDHADIDISYQAVGSGEGVQRLSRGQADFGATEIPVSDRTESDNSVSGSHTHFLQVPVVLGAVVPIYNLPGLRRKINFTPEILAGIYLGKIKNWNDPQISASNSGATLPDAKIVVVHRSDSSGTSFVWSDYLSKVSPQWKVGVGVGGSINWPVGLGAAYNEGVAATVQKTPNSVGYVEFIYAIQHELSFGAVRNAAGEFVKADIAKVTEAARSTGSTATKLRASITDPPGKTAYPISTYTWLLIPDQIDDKNKRAVLLELIRWILTSGQKSCSALGYAPLPADIAKQGLEAIDRAMQHISENVQSEPALAGAN